MEHQEEGVGLDGGPQSGELPSALSPQNSKLQGNVYCLVQTSR